ncbi:MAG: hypothetical protein SOS24_07325 [Clostridia bacterium]|nr:hypothetical protein [Clostridia bacterium]
MADAMDTLKNLLGDDAEDKIKNVIGSLSDGSSSGAGGDEYVSQLKGLIGQLASSRSDPRSDLLLSLKPYMRSSRQGSIDNAVKLLNLSRLLPMFKK